MRDLAQVPGFVDLLNDKVIAPNNALKLSKSKSGDYTYKVINYNKDILCADLYETAGLCRSVIINSDNNVVCFAPAKSLPADVFMSKYPDCKSVIAEEFIEGTMINVFYDESVKSWEIATRNTVGARSSFYKSPGAKQFREMFMEAAKECNLDITKLVPTFCYSFVLQHPENRIVVPFAKPQLYLVEVYTIQHADDNSSINISRAFPIQHLIAGTSVKIPHVYEFSKYSELIEKYGSMNTSYDIMGVVIRDPLTFMRTKIRNPVYEQVRRLKGNQPKLQYQYLCLRKEGKVKDYLKFYPESKAHFSEFRDQVHLFTQTLYANYVACYIKKQQPLNAYSDQYRTHMFNLHKIYLDELREKKQFINNTFVQKYVNEMHPSLLMYCLNYNMRKRHVDTIKREDM